MSLIDTCEHSRIYISTMKICLSPEKADIDIVKLAVLYRKCIYYYKYSMNTCTCVFEKTA